MKCMCNRVQDLLVNDKVGAVVHLGVPGTQAIGVGPVLFGDKSIAGRLDQTWYSLLNTRSCNCV
eukprot:SAG31_NODE_54_length_29987_cov_4.570664_17_plen_64_part_00